MSNSLWPHGLYSPWKSPGQNTGVGNLSLLQGIFPTQGLNPGLPYCRQILCQLSHKESTRILVWVAYLCSSRSSQPRGRTGVSWIAGRFFTNWAMRETMILGVYCFLFWKILGRRGQPELGMPYHILYKNKFELSTVFCVLYFCYDFLFIKVFNSELICFYSTLLYLSGH